MDEVYACMGNEVWIWEKGHQDKRKFKGRALSMTSGSWSAFLGEFDTDDIVRAKVKHGFVVVIEGDMSGCGADYTTYLEDTEPTVVDGRWDSGGEEVHAVIDGPHPATWLEVAA